MTDWESKGGWLKVCKIIFCTQKNQPFNLAFD